jgi:hypothetical protein
MWVMIIKNRTETDELLCLRFLNARMNLSSKDLNHYLNLEKGYSGELKFDKLLLENASDELLTINDLLLEYKNSFFQIDTVLISKDTIFLNDVKNFEGDYYVDGSYWYTISKNEIKNPLEQLKRSESLFRRYLHSLGFPTTIESQLIFINPQYYLYQAPMNEPIIFPSQLYRYIDKLNKRAVKAQDRHMKLAEYLVANHIKKSPFIRLPSYSYQLLKKRIMCKQCYSLNVVIQEGKFVICKCGCKEEIDAAILRSVEEYRLLFPERKVTTNDIFEWCGKVKNKKEIWRLLSRNFRVIGHGKYSYYIIDDRR